MRRTTEDKTLERNYQQKWRFLIQEYLLVKQKKHPRFKFVTDFYKAHDISRQTFCKYYARYQLSGDIGDVLPQKRGPRWESRRPEASIEAEVIKQRKLGLNRYEIFDVLKKKVGKSPSPSGIYNILRRNNLNKMTTKQKESKRAIIKERAGQLGHIDCHYLSKDLIVNENKRQYLVCIIDDYSRIAWAEVVDDIKSLTVMFTSLKLINLLNSQYKIQFEEVLSDNGSEFSSRSGSKEEHPFERMLIELGIKHRYTRPYRPQTNGKVERFWRTLNDDLIEGTTFESLDEFKEALEKYLFYYNEIRPHQGIKGKSPIQKLGENLSTN